jgi:hypothetical protein
MKQASIFRTASVFLLVGPATPFLLLIGAMVVIAGANATRVSFDGFAGSFFRGLVLAYLTGGVQAGLAGVVCALLSPRLLKLGGWLGTCFVVGAAMGAASVVVWVFMPYLWVQLGVVYAVFGAVGGLAGGLATRNRRPLPDLTTKTVEVFA